MKCNDKELITMLRCDEADAQHQPLLDHIESCSRCQDRLAELAATENNWQRAALALSMSQNDEHADGPEFQREPSPRLAGWTERPIAWDESMVQRLLDPPGHPEMLGRLGRYEIERLIGSGGMGIVFKAFDTELNRPVAIKILAPYLANNGSAKKRFAREARAAAGVVDDHVVPIHNVESENEPPFLVMQYVAGGSLQEKLDRDGPLAPCEVLRIGMQTATGLAAAHAQGLIHRDVKPSNILLDEGVERALLTDFGLARSEDDACLTRSGFHPGTPHYMSPEQVRGEAIDARSDLFGLGCVLYALCTGHPPFRAATSYAVLRRITDDSPWSIREVNADIPAWLERIVMKLLAKSADGRLDSAEEVAKLLEDCLAHVQQPSTSPLPESLRDIQTTPKVRPQRIASNLFRHKKWILTMFTAFVSLLFAGAFWSVTAPPDIAGMWFAEDGDAIELRKTEQGKYEGQYPIGEDNAVGSMKITWSRSERRFNGAWKTNTKAACGGTLSLRFINGEIRGAMTANEVAQKELAAPKLADFVWKRRVAKPSDIPKKPEPILRGLLPPTQPNAYVPLDVFEQPRNSTSGHFVGVVSEALEGRAGRLVTISLKDVDSVRIGESLVVNRPQPEFDVVQYVQFATVEIQSVLSENAVGLVVASTREVVDNKYEFMQVKVGDRISRPRIDTPKSIDRDNAITDSFAESMVRSADKLNGPRGSRIVFSSDGDDCESTYKPKPAAILEALAEREKLEPKSLLGLYEKHRDDFTFTVAKTKDEMQPERLYPTVGRASFHRIHYKCTVSFTENLKAAWPIRYSSKEKREEVVYIDVDHLHRDELADDPETQQGVRKPHPSELGTARILWPFRVQDKEGRPVAGATVSIGGLRADEDRGGHYPWPNETMGAVPSVQTDAAGSAKLWYPDTVGTSHDLKQVTKLTVSITHPDFAGLKNDFDVTQTQNQSIERGHSVAITAIDAGTKQPIEEFSVYGTDYDTGAQWTLNSGELTTNSMPFRGETVLLASLGDEQPRTFSSVMAIDSHAIVKGRIEKVPMSSGFRVTGKLDGKLPRPVVNGRVVAAVRFDESQALKWYDYTEINDDGTFAFESLPMGAEVQLMAYAEGWHCVSDGTHRGKITGLTYKPVKPALDVTVMMQKSATINVTVLDENDKPVPGIELRTWPNQLWLGRGSNWAGKGTRSGDWLDRSIRGDRAFVWEDWQSFSSVANDNGVAHLTNVLNTGVYIGIAVNSTKYQQPGMQSNGRYRSNFDIKPGQHNEVTLHVSHIQKKATTTSKRKKSAKENAMGNPSAKKASKEIGRSR